MKAGQSIKIIKLIVKNYRGIGSPGLEIDIDDMVVLVGPNNSGKSTILKAFRLVTASDVDTKIKEDDFYNKDIVNKPEIEIWSKVLDINGVNIDKDKWINGDGLVKEKWLWNCPGDTAKRVGFRVDLDRWAENSDSPQAPFGNDGAAASAYRPSPTYISPFEQPEKQVEEIKKIISAEVYEAIKNQKKEDKNYIKLLEEIKSLQGQIKAEAETKEREIADDLGKILNDLFVNTKISLDVPQNNPDVLSSYAVPKDINFKINNLSLENQGSGMQRALLWSVLKMLADRQRMIPKKTKKSSLKTGEATELVVTERTKILLMDEPEICLHPESIRLAKEILYGLSLGGEWQVMVTTHSPIFIDLSKNNTNIIRVQKEEEAVSLFKTNEAGLSDDEKEQLKMLNIFDPYFAEFFFAKKVIVVEGDTEYTVFRKLIEAEKQKYRDVHIIRARGKYTILPIIKILVKWGKSFSVLHDSDDVENKQSWPANEKILNLVNTEDKVKIKLLACKKNFESAFFDGKEVPKDKPFNAYKKIEDKNINKKVTSLLRYLCDADKNMSTSISSCVCEYKTIKQLENFVK